MQNIQYLHSPSVVQLLPNYGFCLPNHQSLYRSFTAMAPQTYSVSPGMLDEVRTVLQEKGLSQEKFSEVATGLLGGVRATSSDSGISRETVRKFLSGGAVATDIFIALCKALNLNHGDIAAEIYKPPCNIPLSGAEEFVGREGKLLELHSDLSTNQYVAVSGMGGIGKTELAIQYGQRYLDHYAGGVCWISARTKDTEDNSSISSQILSFVRIKQIIPNIPPGFTTDREVVDYCYENWKKGKVLLIFDDVEHFEKGIKQLLPKNPRFRAIITTRLLLGSPCKYFPLEELNRTDSLELLRKLVKDERIDNEPYASNSLCEFLGDLPLGIELSGKYLHFDPGLTVSAYLQKLNELAERRKAVYHAAFRGDANTDPTWGLTAKRGIAPAFDLTWEKLDTDGKLVSVFLGRFRQGLSIPWLIVDAMKQEQATDCPQLGGYDPDVLETSRDNLIKYNLLKLSRPSEYKLHPLTREFFRSKITDEEFKLLGDIDF